MSETVYCPSCAALLSRTAAVCGECGRRLKDFEADRAPGIGPSAWGRAPVHSATPPPAPTAEPTAEGTAEPETASGEPRIERIRVTDRSASGHDAEDRTTIRRIGHTRDATTPRPVDEPAFPYPLDGCEPAPLGRRILATVIDGVLTSGACTPLVIGLLLILGTGEVTMLSQLLVGVGSGLIVAYAAAQWYLQASGGASPGKLGAGLRLTPEPTAGRPGFGRVLLRYLLWCAVWILPPVGLLFALSPALDPLRRALHDRITGLVLTDARAGRDPIAPRRPVFDRPPDHHYLADRAQGVSDPLRYAAAPGSLWRAESPAPASGVPVPASGGHGGWAPSPQPAPAEPAPVPATPLEQVRLVFDDGRIHTVRGSALIGRNPTPEAGETVGALVSLRDQGRSLSKTHLLVRLADGRILVTDRGSTNGSAAIDARGTRTPLEPGVSREIPVGETVTLGRRSVRLEMPGE